MLYLTVLGFDSITISFCKASGVDESLVSFLGKNRLSSNFSINRLDFLWECLHCLVSWEALLFPF